MNKFYIIIYISFCGPVPLTRMMCYLTYSGELSYDVLVAAIALK